MTDWGNQHDEWLESVKQEKWDEGYVQGFEDAKSRYWWKAFAAGWGLVGLVHAYNSLYEAVLDVCDNAVGNECCIRVLDDLYEVL